MTDIFHTQVALHGYDFQDSQLTFNLNASMVAANVGAPVALDAATPNTVKLAGDGDEIIGVLMTFEDRTIEGQKVGTVELRFAKKLKIKTGETVVVGNRLVGAGGGEVKAFALPTVSATPTGAQVTAAANAAAVAARSPLVVAVANGFATALKI